MEFEHRRRRTNARFLCSYFTRAAAERIPPDFFKLLCVDFLRDPASVFEKQLCIEQYGCQLCQQLVLQDWWVSQKLSVRFILEVTGPVAEILPVSDCLVVQTDLISPCSHSLLACRQNCFHMTSCTHLSSLKNSSSQCRLHLL